jgi:LuxR family maltose regulon positive regulatory protein
MSWRWTAPRRELSEDQLDDILNRTEGWPAGLHLAALAIGDRTYESFSGRDHLTGDYLIEEVLEVMSAEVVEFLERSATFEYLDAEMLDSVLERTDGAQMLTAIRSSGNLFLIPLDDKGRRFRYHHLFREVLKSRLSTREPDVARRLDSRASVWLERAGDLDGAVRHALNAREEERAANLILRATLPRFFDGRFAQVGEWLALLGDEAVTRHPAAAVATAWHSIACGEPERARLACAAAEGFGWYGPLADGSPCLPAALATVRIFLAADGVQGVLRDAEIVREAGGPAWNPWWALATGAQATAYSMLGDFELARQRIAEAMAVAGGAPFIEASGSAHLALLALYDGDLVEAERLAQRGRHLADRHHLDAFVPAVAVYAIAALVSARTRDHENARSAATIARSVIARLGDVSPRTSVFVLLLLAQTAVTLGDRAEARVLVTEANRARRRDASATFLNDQLDRLVEQLGSAGDLSLTDVEPLTTAELRVLDYLPTHLSLREIAGILIISRNTVKSHSLAIYRKLGASSRSDAVNAARRLGLLTNV